jgi:hypothetical protein
MPKGKLPMELRWVINDVTDCWEVVSHKKDANGYIPLKRNYKTIKAHRYMFMKHKGNIPDELVVRHKCDVRHCVNPDHLELGTPADNARDASERGRIVTQRGSNHKNSKLTEHQVLEIKRRLNNGEKASHIYFDYDVPRRSISAIKTGRSWGWLTDESQIS